MQTRANYQSDVRLRVLATIRDHCPITQDDIAAFAEVNPKNLPKAMRALQAHDLIHPLGTAPRKPGQGGLAPTLWHFGRAPRA
jgi:chromosome segregation and condensation protein ScpB